MSLDRGWHDYHHPQPPVDAVVLCCPVIGKLKPVTRLCLETYGQSSVEFRWLDPGNEWDLRFGLYQAIRDHWRQGRDLILVDQDMVFIYENLRVLSDCPEGWCSCPAWDYNEHLRLDAGIGFAKFTAAAQLRISLSAAAADWQLCGHCEGDWWGLEAHLGNQACGDLGVQGPHRHMESLNDHSRVPEARPGHLGRFDPGTPEGRDLLRQQLSG